MAVVFIDGLFKLKQFEVIVECDERMETEGWHKQLRE
jgi:hypothetical protein